MSLPALFHRAVTVALNFVREHAPESATRLVMILCAITGCIIGLGTLLFAFRHHDQPSMVMALNGTITLFIGSGCIAIALRTRKDAEPGDPPPPTPPGSPT